MLIDFLPISNLFDQINFVVVPKRNVVFFAEDIVIQSANNDKKAMMHDQFHNLYHLLQYV